MTISLGAFGIKGEETTLEATLDFTEQGFEFAATSSSPLSGRGLTAVSLEAKFPVLDVAALHVAANNVTSEENSFDVGGHTQVLPRLSANVEFEDVDDVKVNAEFTWQALDALKIGFGVKDVSEEKVADLEVTFTPSEAFVLGVRAKDLTHSSTRSFNLEAAYQLNDVGVNASIKNIPDPVVGTEVKFKLNHNTSLELIATPRYIELS